MKPKPWEKFVNVTDKSPIGKGSNHNGVHHGEGEINPSCSREMRIEEAKAKGQRLVLSPYDNRFGNIYTKGE